ncbi:hypothetical protein [Streptococcus mutans]|jgi:hypothetical protein|uniref:hypothetical protein n=2 Tax=Streptococcus mutans TaxID=1309 RepID=UPI0002B5AF03|nr:hypothetical protein [Streptococcus mutans]EMB77034.1 hypothetical protein SMU44_09044 [Streptococcus mutans 11VS1]AVM72349.1 hypothetical protein CO204_09975 [Streptococcus mutans]EMB63450.1 hypothetical protein SMU26_10055 [Streptococcus mutans 3SN1]EMB98557.1 hypothetical protein SMU68_10143 [Streptococcus mutans NFSM1]EMC18038.1 hypothetical protein SMU80_10173 [Streptococcus mutans SF1]
MVTNKKIVSLILITLAICLFSLFLYFRSRVYWKYDNHWMIGKNRTEIEKRYGKFDSSILGNNKEVYMIKDNPLSLIYDNDKAYFVMVFDNKGKCVKVYQYTPPGL